MKVNILGVNIDRMNLTQIIEIIKNSLHFVGDTKYGTRRNRADLETLSVRPSFKPLGRAAKKTGKDPWFRKKQKERNGIEGAFGNGKEHYGLSRVRYKGEESSEVWVRTSLLAMNLKTALKRA